MAARGNGFPRAWSQSNPKRFVFLLRGAGGGGGGERKTTTQHVAIACTLAWNNFFGSWLVELMFEVVAWTCNSGRGGWDRGGVRETAPRSSGSGPECFFLVPSRNCLGTRRSMPWPMLIMKSSLKWLGRKNESHRSVMHFMAKGHGSKPKSVSPQ